MKKLFVLLLMAFVSCNSFQKKSDYVSCSVIEKDRCLCQKWPDYKGFAFSINCNDQRYKKHF